MKVQNSTQPKLTSNEIMNQIMDGIEKIDIGRFDYHYIPFKSDFTKAMTASIIQTSKRLNLRVVPEVDFEMSEKFRKTYKRKIGGVIDFIIINPDGKDIAIELDSSNKKASYGKLQVLSDKGYDAFWIVWNRNTSGRPYSSSYKNDHSTKNLELGFTNKNVNILRHTFHPTPKK